MNSGKREYAVFQDMTFPMVVRLEAASNRVDDDIFCDDDLDLCSLAIILDTNQNVCLLGS